eukprot:3032248-Pleurochrysis_carterae.AAC.1
MSVGNVESPRVHITIGLQEKACTSRLLRGDHGINVSKASKLARYPCRGRAPVASSSAAVVTPQAASSALRMQRRAARARRCGHESSIAGAAKAAWRVLYVENVDKQNAEDAGTVECTEKIINLLPGEGSPTTLSR